MKTNNETLMRIENLSKLYGMEQNKAIKLLDNGLNKGEVFKKTGVTVALWDINLEVYKGEILVIIGLSGSGKSTLVRLMNELIKPTDGKIIFENSEINKFNNNELLEYRRNKVSMVFQNFGLMNHRDVLSNIAYGLEVKGVNRVEREKIATDMLNMVGLEGHEHSSISSLSGGMKQRVGLARALANNPELLLMDEPFSALVPLVRKEMQYELLSIQRKLEKTVVFITHDMNEAFHLGDRVAIMRDGRLIQLGTPEEITENPHDEYVKEFIETADKTKVLTVKQIMSRPCVIRETDSPIHAIREMRFQNVSTAYVVGRRMHLLGIVDISSCIKASRECQKDVTQILDQDIKRALPDTLIGDIMAEMTVSNYPIAIVDEQGVLLGIVTKASVLSAII